MRWSYKTVHYDLKKEGILGSAFLDESEIELSLNQYGKAGWELVSLLETMDGLIAVFKQPLGLDTRSFSSLDALPERIDRLSIKGETKTKRLQTTGLEHKNSSAAATEDVAEAILLDEFEAEENDIKEERDRVEQAVDKTVAPPVDVGMIRIE